MVFVVMLISSLYQEQIGDAVYLHYLTYLFDRHAWVPYRDVFTINLPTTYLFHLGVGKLLGYTDMALTWAHVFMLAALLGVTYLVLRSFGKVSALAGCLLFGLIYLGFGPVMRLQREFIALIPIAVAVLLVCKPRSGPAPPRLQASLGALLGAVVFIKPHLIIGLPFLVLFGCVSSFADFQHRRKLLHSFLHGAWFAAIGFVIVVALPLLWLWKTDGLEVFWKITSSYTPLYARMSDDLVFREGSDRILHVLKGLAQVKSFSILGFAVVFSTFTIVRSKATFAVKKRIMLLLLLTILYAFTVVVGGKVLSNYLLPFLYFASLGAALLLGLTSQAYRMRLAALLIFVVVLLSVLRMPYSLFRYKRENQEWIPPRYPMESTIKERKDEIRAYLGANLLPAHTVQPLSWIGGPIEAMLAVRAKPATPYLWDMCFYHHVSNPYIQSLRTHFLEALDAAPPEFIIQVDHYELQGPDTSTEFGRLTTFLQQNYEIDHRGDHNLVIYRKKRMEGKLSTDPDSLEK